MVVTVRKVSQIPPPPKKGVLLCNTQSHWRLKLHQSNPATFNTVWLFEIVPKNEKLRNNHYKLKVYLNLNSFNPETQAWSWTQLLPPLHVTWLGYSTFPLFLLSGFTGVYFYHLLEQILQKESLLLTIGKCRKGDSFFHSQDVNFSSQHYLAAIHFSLILN